jgi:hypothetical protein
VGSSSLAPDHPVNGLTCAAYPAVQPPRRTQWIGSRRIVSRRRP